jgi:Ca2+-dependent lipid-binding protein
MVETATAINLPEVLLFLSFHELRGKDLLSKSDPRATVLVGGRTVGQTEAANNVHDGAWATPIRVSAIDQQVIKVIVVDRDVYKSHDSLGQACFTLGSVMSSPRRVLRVSLRERADHPDMAVRSPTGLALPYGGGELGSISVRAEQANPGAGLLTLQLAAAKLDKKDFGGLRSSDPYVVLSRQDDSHLWFPVFRSEVIKKTSSPTWAIAEIAMDRLCQGDKSKRLKLSVMDRDYV